MCPWEAMGGGDYNRNFLYPIGGAECGGGGDGGDDGDCTLK